MVHICAVIIVVCVATGWPNTVLADDDGLPVVSTSYGPVQGLKERSSWTNKTIYSFRGIPYAVPPVGKLRFKDPTPAMKWSSVRNCSVEGPSCYQPGMNSPEASEDCLFVNVYSPQIGLEGVLLPVMVWIHGGSFMSGSGDYKSFGPDLLVGQGVVVVTLNYRLGALGFFTLGTREAPGNAGMKDQRLALKWVQSEIHQFGGDPREVTLFGESAGSSSVHLHYLSPTSTGLFHKVIGQSAVHLDIVVREDGPHYGMKLAELLNCSTHDTQTALKCLMEADAQDIITAQTIIIAPPEDAAAVVGGLFLPTVDGEVSDDPFLPKNPLQLIEQKEGSVMPFIIGMNSDEGMLVTFFGDIKERLNITNNLDYVVPSRVRNSCTKERLAELKDRLKHFYFSGSPPSERNIGDCVKIYTDFYFGRYAALSARYFQKRDNVFLYRFSFNGQFKRAQQASLEEEHSYSGVSHAEELGYIFADRDLNQRVPEDTAAMKTWRRMVKLWTNFAKYGKPTVGKDSELQNVTWLPVKETSTRYLEISTDLVMVNSDLLGPSVALWDTITPSASTILKPMSTIMASFTFLLMAKQIVCS